MNNTNPTTRRTLLTTARPEANVPADLDLVGQDWIVINSSGGKDSSAQMSAILRATDAAGVDRSKVIVAHADLGRVEWKGTRELAAKQAAFFGLEFFVVARAKGDLLDQILARGMFPSNVARFCTSDQKTAQVHKLFTQLGKQTKAELKAAGQDKRPAKILSCLGIRAQESPARAKKTTCEIEKKPTGKGTAKVVTRWLPIHHWTHDQVWAEIAESGQEAAGLIHPAYTVHKMPRLSCVFCVMAPNLTTFVRAGIANPELLTTYVELEAKIGHTFGIKLSMADVAEAIANGATGEVDDSAAQGGVVFECGA